MDYQSRSGGRGFGGRHNNEWRGGGGGGRSRGGRFGPRGGRSSRGGGQQGRGGSSRGGPLYKLVIEMQGGVENSGNKAIKDLALWWPKQQLFGAFQDASLKLYNLSGFDVAATIPAGEARPQGRGVEAVLVEGNWLFVGTEAAVPLIPNVAVGLVRAWNLENPQVPGSCIIQDRYKMLNNSKAPPYEFAVSEHMPYSHNQCVTALAVAADPTTRASVLYSGGLEGRNWQRIPDDICCLIWPSYRLIRVWTFDAAQNRFVCKASLEGHARGVTSLVVLDNMLISGSMDATIRFWDMASLKCVNLFSSQQGGHTGGIMALAIYMTSPTDRYLLSGGLDGVIHAWNLQQYSHEFADKQDGAVTALCVTTDSAAQPTLLLGLQDGNICVKELPSFDFKCAITPHPRFGHQGAVRKILAVPDAAHTFFSAGEDSIIRCWKWIAPLSTIH